MPGVQLMQMRNPVLPPVALGQLQHLDRQADQGRLDPDLWQLVWPGQGIPDLLRDHFLSLFLDKQRRDQAQVHVAD